MDILSALQIVAVVAFAHFGELALGEGERYVEEQREVGTGKRVMAEFEVHDPVGQPIALLAGGKFGALETHVRVDVTVQHHRFSFGEPLPYLRRGVGAVARKNQRHEVGIDLLHAAEFAAQEPGDQLAVYGRIEAREMHILALDAPVGKQLAQHAYLGRFARSVQSFEYNEHRLPVLFPFVVVMVVSSSQRSIRTARSTPSASASASACVL